MKTALIVIDVQNYFAVEKAEYLPGKIAAHIRHSQYDYVLFTKFRNDPDSPFHTLLHFTDATKPPSIDLHDDVSPFVTSENVFEKTTYSPFKLPAFSEYLKTNNITTLELCGINFDGCVLATAFDAFDLGYDVAVLDTLCSVASSREELIDAAQMIIRRNLRPREFRIKRG